VSVTILLRIIVFVCFVVVVFPIYSSVKVSFFIFLCCKSSCFQADLFVTTTRSSFIVDFPFRVSDELLSNGYTFIVGFLFYVNVVLF